MPSTRFITPYITKALQVATEQGVISSTQPIQAAIKTRLKAVHEAEEYIGQQSWRQHYSPPAQVMHWLDSFFRSFDPYNFTNMPQEQRHALYILEKQASVQHAICMMELPLELATATDSRSPHHSLMGAFLVHAGRDMHFSFNSRGDLKQLQPHEISRSIDDQAHAWLAHRLDVALGKTGQHQPGGGIENLIETLQSLSAPTQAQTLSMHTAPIRGIPPVVSSIHVTESKELTEAFTTLIKQWIGYFEAISGTHNQLLGAQNQFLGAQMLRS